MGLIRTPDGTCARDNVLHEGGITCWVAVIPAQPVAGQFDNSHGGTGFMLGSLDFYGFAARCRPPVTTGSRRGPGPGCPRSTARAAPAVTPPSASPASSSPASTVLRSRD